jgi:diguanylate cyclase (GGDEF)-like protein/PAS domain S-box-containing protein
MTAVRDITARRAMEQDLRENAERLRRSEAALRTLLESAPIILYAADADGTITLSEGTGLAALGLKPGEAVGRNLRDFQNSAESADYTRRALAGEAVSYDTQVGGIWLHVALQPVHGADGGPGGLIGVCFDVTERIASEERFRVLFERAPHPHLLFDEQGGIIDCNDATLALMRCADKAALLGVHPALLSPEFQPDGRPSAEKGAEMVALAWEQGGHRFEWRRRDMGGHEFPVEVTLTPVTLGGRPVLLSVWHDLTERKRAEREAEDYRVVLEFQKQELEKANAELAALATTDGLTGLRNHRALQERLADEVAHTERYGAPLSLLLLDVDHFKQYNDAFGHPAGDDVLRRVARLLEADIRNTDTAARYGGEEFVIILPQTDADGAHVIAERVRAAIEAAPWDGRSVTVSIGVCTFALTTHTPAAMLACADAALYRSKADGRNRVTHGAPAAPAMDSTPLPDMALASH